MIVLVHDYETTGVNSKRCGVVQSAIWIAEFEADGSYEVLAEEVALHNPGMPIPDGASKVHGIYNDDVAHLPVFTESLSITMDQAFTVFKPEAVMGYNNTGFDNVIAQRFGMPEDGFLNIDLFPMIRRMKGKGLVSRAALSVAYAELTGDTQVDKAHDAEFDLKMTCALAPVLMKHLGIGTFHELVGVLNTVVVDTDMPMPFGKHQGLPLSEVPNGYRKWLLKDRAKLDPDLRASLEELEAAA